MTKRHVSELVQVLFLVDIKYLLISFSLEASIVTCVPQVVVLFRKLVGCLKWATFVWLLSCAKFVSKSA